MYHLRIRTCSCAPRVLSAAGVREYRFGRSPSMAQDYESAVQRVKDQSLTAIFDRKLRSCQARRGAESMCGAVNRSGPLAAWVNFGASQPPSGIVQLSDTTSDPGLGS